MRIHVLSDLHLGFDAFDPPRTDAEQHRSARVSAISVLFPVDTVPTARLAPDPASAAAWCWRGG